MIASNDLKDILLQSKILDQEQYDQFTKEAKEKDQTLENFLLAKKIISEELLYEAAAKYYKLPFVKLKDMIIDQKTLRIIPEVTARSYETIAFQKSNQDLHIATSNAYEIELVDFIQKKTGLKPKIFFTSPEHIQEAIKQYHQGLSLEMEKIKQDVKTNKLKDKKTDLKDLAQDLPIVKIVDTMLEYAFFEKSSDIHIEPAEKEVTVRYRIDGLLKKVMTLPKSVHPGIIARIKILSNLKLDEHRLPQDGRFKKRTEKYQASFRVSIIPTFDGEKAVLRLLPDDNSKLTLEDLGFQPEILKIIKRNIAKPHGMVLVTGPTGSGKTTTLYTILNILNKPEVNIATVEDPIEYRIKGVNQSQTQPKIGFTFAAGLRSLLRQDPDIIMVGEIRDNETAEIGVNAAMTGHLVLSTLHTNDAVTAIPRLTDMKVPTFLIASTVNVIIAQRLVRRLCKNCLESYNLDEKAVKELEKNFNIKELDQRLKTKGFLNKNQSLRSVLYYRSNGCNQCNNTGYKGRVGIYEVLEITPKISSLIVQKATRNELEQAALENEMTTLLEDGLIKAKSGVTSIEEILRVTKE